MRPLTSNFKVNCMLLSTVTTTLVFAIVTGMWHPSVLLLVACPVLIVWSAIFEVE